MLRKACLIAVMALAPGVATAQQPCTADARRVVAEVYQRVLARPMDANAEPLVARLSSGQTTVRQIVAAVAKLPEHQRRLSANRTEAVGQLYQHVLGRAADAPGLRDYVNGGGSYSEIVDSFVSSGEYAGNFGDYGVPGSTVRYCGPGESPLSNARAGDQMRFAGMDANNNGQIERHEWNGTRESFVVQDWNGDNVLSGDEVSPAGRRAGRQAAGSFTAWNAETFTTLDRNRDGRLAAGEWRHDTQSFVTADRNGDGVLSRTEFLDGASASAVTDTEPVQTAAGFNALDLNRNGRIERGEWRDSADAFDWLDRNRDNSLSRAEVIGRQSARSRFDELDTDGNGQLSLNEWPNTRRAFTQSDANGDGVLTRREFNQSGAVGTTGR